MAPSSAREDKTAGKRIRGTSIWVWVKIQPPGDRRFYSLFPFTRVPFWGYPIFDPPFLVGIRLLDD